MAISRLLSGWSEVLVKKLADHKTTVLGFALLATAVFAVISLLMVFGEHEGGQLTHLAADIGGFVAIVGLLIGFPALGYAMVTDRTVAQISILLGLPVGTLEEQIHAKIKGSDWKLWRRHYIQVFMPGMPDKTVVVMVYDRKPFPSSESWSIDPGTPQGITGSAWVNNKYMLGLGDDLKHPRLRLSDEQLNRFHRLTGVAALPIHDPALGASEEARIGVLTIVTDAKRKLMMKETGFEERCEELAKRLAPVLVAARPKSGPLEQEDDLKEGQAALEEDRAAAVES